MGFHHVAFATKDTAATHAFYTDVMSFSLVKVVTAPTESGGWSKHFFYDTGGNGLIAFWELHDEKIGDGYRTDLSESLGLPVFVNHMAFDAPTADDLGAARDRWLAHGITVYEVDHEFCVSIYATDPNGIMVEFCHSTREFTSSDVDEAQRLLADPNPPMNGDAKVTVHRPERVGAAS